MGYSHLKWLVRCLSEFVLTMMSAKFVYSRLYLFFLKAVYLLVVSDMYDFAQGLSLLIRIYIDIHHFTSVVYPPLGSLSQHDLLDLEAS